MTPALRLFGAQVTAALAAASALAAVRARNELVEVSATAPGLAEFCSAQQALLAQQQEHGGASGLPQAGSATSTAIRASLAWPASRSRSRPSASRARARRSRGGTPA